MHQIDPPKIKKMDLCRLPTAATAFLVASILLFFVISRSWKIIRRRRGCSGGGGGGDGKKKGPQLPAGTLGWPLVGETLDFISSACSPSPETFMNKRRLLYGKVFKTHLFGSPTIVSVDADVSRWVLQSDARWFVPAYPKSLRELMGKSSILAINGGLQRRVHGLLGAFLRSPHLKARVAADMQRYLRLATARWHDGRQIHLQDEAKNVIFQILVKALIGLEPGSEMRILREQFKEFIAGLMSWPVKLPGCRLYRSLQAKKKMVGLIRRIIEVKRKKRKAAATCEDVVDVLMKDPSEELTDELICDNVINLMIPAEDSVPVLVTLAVKFLTQCPLALQQLEEENMQLELKKTNDGVDLLWSDYMSLSFTQDVITETLRLGNVISGIMRKAMRDVEIKGHFIPKGWCVFAFIRSVHLDESLYEDPYTFNPWRWKEKDTGGVAGFAPFGGGQRLCPGLELARLEAAVFLHHLLSGFSWVAEEEDQIVNFPTVRMKKGMPIRVYKKRNPSPVCNNNSEHKGDADGGNI